MKKFKLTRLTAAALAAAMTITAAPAVYAEESEEPIGTIIYHYDFEDGDVSDFTNRGGDDTTEISITDEASVSGSKALLASGRTQDWNGPAFRLDDKLEPNTEYYLSAKVRGKYYTNATFSYQYTVDGVTQYRNLKQNINGSDWQSIMNMKISFDESMEGVYIYFEGGLEDILIDDFIISEVPVVEIEKDIPSLSWTFSNDFKVGTAITPTDLSSKPTMALIKKHLNKSITVGNEMKPDSVLSKTACQKYFEETGDDETPQISFSAAKPVLNYCKKNNIPVRIHTLVWHSQTPDWFFKEGYSDEGDFVSPEKMLKRMENYIKIYFETLTELYPTIDFYACDVVNEAWTDGGTPREPGVQSPNGSEKSAWVQVFGDNSFIEPAFTFAKKYAPEGCKLYYNDYNEYMDGKMNAITEMVKDLKAKGVIDGIGMQSHLDARQSLDAAFPSVAMYNRALDNYCSLGLDVQITELDATTPENPTASDFEVQAKYYKGIWDAIYAHKDNISAVIIWGITDDASWRANKYPLLFDGNYKAKSAFYSILEGYEAPGEEPTEPDVQEPTPTICGQEHSFRDEVTAVEEGVITFKENGVVQFNSDAWKTVKNLKVGDVVEIEYSDFQSVAYEVTKLKVLGGEAVEVSLLGDANCDGKVTIADSTAILQHMANQDKYGLSKKGEENADVFENGSGITGTDAIVIQMVDAKLIKQSALPVDKI